MTTISGRVYTRTRPRGFADWSPRPDTLALLAQVRTVLVEYQEYLPLTVRQVFYRLVGAYSYEKTELAYARLCEHLNRARRARLIDMDAIRDDGTAVQRAPGFTGPAGFWAAVRATAERYGHRLDDGQPLAVEVWVEAAGMLPQVARVAHDYGADVYSAGGFDSVTEKYAAAVRIADRWRSTTVLHVGDFDPSGLSILDSVAEDVAAFVADLGGHIPTFARLAVTPEQIAHYRLPTAPQKPTDRRGERMAETVQAEALTPDQLASELRTALEQVTDLAALAHAEALGRSERRQILDALGDLEAGQ